MKHWVRLAPCASWQALASERMQACAWVVRLHRRIRAKRKAANIIGPFLASCAQQGMTRVAVHLFT